MVAQVCKRSVCALLALLYPDDLFIAWGRHRFFFLRRPVPVGESFLKFSTSVWADSVSDPEACGESSCPNCTKYKTCLGTYLESYNLPITGGLCVLWDERLVGPGSEARNAMMWFAKGSSNRIK